MIEEKQESKVIEIERTQFKIPECCREGWESCPHVAKEQRKSKQNVGL